MSGAVKRFRVMALIAGVMSLLLWFVDLPVAYLFNNEDWKAKVAWIPFVHGWSLCRLPFSGNPIFRKSALGVAPRYMAGSSWHFANCFIYCRAQNC